MTVSITKPTIGGSEDTWGSTINTALDLLTDTVNGSSGTISPNLSALKINGTTVTATSQELNSLDGFTGTFDDLNYAKDLRATGFTASDIGVLDGAASNTVVNNKAVVYGSAGQIQAVTIDLGNWTITESGGTLFFATSGSNKAKLDANGNFTVTGNVTAFGSV